MEQTNQNLEFSNTITLLNGTTLPLFLKPEQSSKILPDALRLDATGQYFSIGNYKPRIMKESDEAEFELQYKQRLFTENAWFLLDHAEEIFSDSRMFLAPVWFNNGLAYFDNSRFRYPTVGVYLEWWLNNREKAIDANGNLVCSISGSPLSGMDRCFSVTPEGKQVRAKLRTSVGGAGKSFADVNTRYKEAKQIAEIYSLEQVLLKLRAADYQVRMIEIKHELVYEKLKRYNNRLEKRFDALTKLFAKRLNQNKKIHLEANKDLILEFAKDYFEKEEQYKALYDIFVKQRWKLKEQLHAGTINGDYRALVAIAGKESRALRTELIEASNNFMRFTFGKNPNELSLKEVLNFAKQKIKEL